MPTIDLDPRPEGEESCRAVNPALQEWDADEGDEEMGSEEEDEERGAEEGPEENGKKLHPKIRKDFQNVFEQFVRLKKYLSPPEQCFLKGLQLTILGDGQAHRNENVTETLLKSIIEQQHQMQSLLMDVYTRVKNIEKILTERYPPLTVQDTRTSIFKYISCPVNSLAEFEKLDGFLRKGENAKYVAYELSNIGGANSANFVKRTLGAIISDILASQFSWFGKKGKRRFDSTQLATVLVDAATIAKVSKTKNDTEVAIQKWLRRAPGRTRYLTKDF